MEVKAKSGHWSRALPMYVQAILFLGGGSVRHWLIKNVKKGRVCSCICYYCFCAYTHACFRFTKYITIWILKKACYSIPFANFLSLCKVQRPFDWKVSEYQRKKSISSCNLQNNYYLLLQDSFLSAKHFWLQYFDYL